MWTPGGKLISRGEYVSDKNNDVHPEQMVLSQRDRGDKEVTFYFQQDALSEAAGGGRKAGGDFMRSSAGFWEEAGTMVRWEESTGQLTGA